MHDIVIIGGGPAGYTAAIYAGRAGYKPVVIEGYLPGGQLTQTTVIENFPGFPNGIQGMELMDNMRKQAEHYASFTMGSVTEFSNADGITTLKLDSEEQLQARAVIIATGAAPKMLGLNDEKSFIGRGLSTCATCDGFFYRKKVVGVVGGGDTAAEEALYLSTICEHVYLFIRKDYMRASQIMQQRVTEKENITVCFNTQVAEIIAEKKMTAVKLTHSNGTPDEELALNGLFLAIGHTPNSKVFTGVQTDEAGYIKTLNGTQQTNLKGVFAAGDVADPNYKQAITAAASGCRAATDAIAYLKQL